MLQLMSIASLHPSLRAATSASAADRPVFHTLRVRAIINEGSPRLAGGGNAHLLVTDRFSRFIGRLNRFR